MLDSLLKVLRCPLVNTYMLCQEAALPYCANCHQAEQSLQGGWILSSYAHELTCFQSAQDSTLLLMC